MFEEYDLWINAVLALAACTPKNPKPLAAMLRGDTPIPPGIRDALAELIDPGKPEYLGCKLVLKETGETRKNLRKLATVGGVIASANGKHSATSHT